VVKVIITTKKDGFDVDVLSREYQEIIKVTETIYTTATSCAKGFFQGPYFHVNDDKSLIFARSNCVLTEGAVDEVIFLISDTLDAQGYKIEIIPL
jgi:hypothetical protein